MTTFLRFSDGFISDPNGWFGFIRTSTGWQLHHLGMHLAGDTNSLGALTFSFPGLDKYTFGPKARPVGLYTGEESLPPNQEYFGRIGADGKLSPIFLLPNPQTVLGSLYGSMTFWIHWIVEDERNIGRDYYFINGGDDVRYSAVLTVWNSDTDVITFQPYETFRYFVTTLSAFTDTNVNLEHMDDSDFTWIPAYPYLETAMHSNFGGYAFRLGSYYWVLTGAKWVYSSGHSAAQSCLWRATTSGADLQSSARFGLQSLRRIFYGIGPSLIANTETRQAQYGAVIARPPLPWNGLMLLPLCKDAHWNWTVDAGGTLRNVGELDYLFALDSTGTIRTTGSQLEWTSGGDVSACASGAILHDASSTLYRFHCTSADPMHFGAADWTIRLYKCAAYDATTHTFTWTAMPTLTLPRAKFIPSNTDGGLHYSQDRDVLLFELPHDDDGSSNKQIRVFDTLSETWSVEHVTGHVSAVGFLRWEVLGRSRAQLIGV